MWEGCPRSKKKAVFRSRLSAVLQAPRHEHSDRDRVRGRGLLLLGLGGAAGAARGRVRAGPAQVLLQRGLHCGAAARRAGAAHGRHQVSAARSQVSLSLFQVLF
jgi:hypothetical protein